MMSPDGSAKAASGHKRIPIANGRNPKHARTRIRRELSDILYPGALTSRLKRYAAEPAPDGANLTTISERTANGTEKPTASRCPPANPFQAALVTFLGRAARTWPSRLK